MSRPPSPSQERIVEPSPFAYSAPPASYNAFQTSAFLAWPDHLPNPDLAHPAAVDFLMQLEPYPLACIADRTGSPCTFLRWNTSCFNCLVQGNTKCYFHNRDAFILHLGRYRDRALAAVEPSAQHAWLYQFYANCAGALQLWEISPSRVETFFSKGIQNSLSGVTYGDQVLRFKLILKFFKISERLIVHFLKEIHKRSRT
ncbi:hypothetical protein B0H12DRAFT_1068306 [Mycena haematopus]|nr:hypothetical protein B0H12DRAFT_1246848 [Mycena haematopus]KAJ7266438.1 hypothetical protein B0H12DRAFT_1068306 [Mycena haematopus]